jgi:predicted nucleotidyltransferase
VNKRLRIELKGQNRITEFRRIAKDLTSQILKNRNVVGIVLLGGMVRGFADKFSDLDITVFLDKKDHDLCRKIRNIGSQIAKSRNVDIDLMVHYIGDFKKWKMKEEALRWEYSNAKIVFDPTGDVKRVLRAKMRPSKGFWIRRIVVCGEYIKWYCCPPEEGVGTIAGSWIERGDLVSAHYCLNYSVDLLLRLLFAVNQEFVPAPKWRIFYSYNLKWLPSHYRELIQEAMITRSLSLGEFNKRLVAIRKMWRGIAAKIEEETGLTPKTISKYYVQKILQQA